MFGKPLQQPGTLFGTTVPTASSTGFSFGTPAAGTVPASGGFSFGANNPNPASGFSLGSAGTLFTSTNPVSSTVPNTSLTGGTFGVTPTNSVVRPTFSMLQTAQPSIGTGTTGPGLFGGLGAAAPATSMAGGGFGFGAPTLGGTTAGTMTSGFGHSLGGFGTPSLGLSTSLTAPATTSLGIGSFGNTFGTTMTPSLNFLGSSSAITMPTSTLGGSGIVQSTPFVGLGGTGTSQTAAGGAKNDSKTLKEYPVPPEITTLAEDFKKYMKEQKNVREEISRYSSKPIAKVQEEVGSLRQGLSVISNSIQRNTTAIRKLKQETAQESRHVDVMQRTKDMALSLQYENTAPTEYFQRQVVTFEENMKTFRQQIDMLERHLASGASQHAAAFTSSELLSTIRRLYETFVYLASELQTVHENIEKQKERYVAYRRAFYGDGASIFESRASGTTTKSPSFRVATTIGPSPFTNTHGSAILASAMERAQRSTGATHPPPTVGLSSSGGGGGGFNSSSFNLTSGLGTSGLQSSNFMGSSNVMPVKPLGSGALSAPVGGGSGLGGSFASPLANTSSFGVVNSTNFQLQRPPAGNKRGKR